MTALLVFVGAAVGAPLRYLTGRLVASRRFPWGTLTVNVVGSLVLGALAGAGTAMPQAVPALVGIGFCGALTTYSTFSYDTFQLAEQKKYVAAAANVGVTIVAGVGTAVLAYATVAALVG